MSRPRADSDEAYIVSLCDEALGLTGSPQHTFDFLRGDSRDQRLGRRLPVDVYYPELSLVVEYRERQHTQPVPFFDKPDRLTVSGVDRGRQREIYDQRRRETLPQHGIRLVELSCQQFAATPNGMLLRHRPDDLATIRRLLQLEAIARQSEQRDPADSAPRAVDSS